uniref:Uncharacterized protein n=1 Tax=Panagrolaimus davidi TaxID=227884 RepID=A0A914PZH3_9BILA
MMFDACEKFDLPASILTSLNSILPDYNEFNVKKTCIYFNDLDFFDLAFDDVDLIYRLTTRSLKPKTSPEEVEENIEIIQNLGISALLKRNVEVYQTCCKGLWNIGKKYKPLVMAKDKTGLLDNFHLRLKVWTSLYRVYSYSSHNNFASGVLDCNEKDFGDGLSAVHFGSLMNIARLNEKRIPCSCVSTSWKVLIPSSLNSDFLTIYYNFFNLSSPPGNVDSAFFKTAFAYILTLPKEFFITVFYYLFPAFFQDYTKAGRSLYYFYSKIPSLSSELVQKLIECFSQNVPFIPHCETLLKDLTHKVNNGKDEITANYFPDEFTSISTIIKNYRLPSQHCDDKFQLFLRLYVKYLDESGKCESLVSSFESFWGQSKVAKVYSFYLVLLAATTEILGLKYVLKQVRSLSGDTICPQECLFLRFFVLRHTTSSEFHQIFKEFKPKIEASVLNFSSFIKAFPTIAATSALHPSGTTLMFSLISKEVVQRLSVDDLAKFINQIQSSHNLSPVPSFVFELFQKDMSFDLNFVANFFAARLSTSTIPLIEKCFKSNFVTMEFIEKLVEAIIKQEKIFQPINVSFGYQLGLLYCFTKKFMINEEGER